MTAIDNALGSMGGLNEFAGRNSPIHRLDPRAKLITAATFIVTAVSFDRYTVSALLPLTLYPVAICALGGIPGRAIIRKLLIAAPFALMIGIFNPLLDRQIMLSIGPLQVTGGMLSLCSIMLRFVLTVSAALLLVATTGFETVCLALERLKVPRVFVTQLLFLYRYIFVLVEEGLRMRRAYLLRAPGLKAVALRNFGSLSGQLLLRTLNRAQRVHQAMLCRGFDGHVRRARPLQGRLSDMLFVLGWGVFFLLVRLYDLPLMLGRLLEGML